MIKNLFYLSEQDKVHHGSLQSARSTDFSLQNPPQGHLPAKSFPRQGGLPKLFLKIQISFEVTNYFKLKSLKN
jgi:hypothetical protein